LKNTVLEVKHIIKDGKIKFDLQKRDELYCILATKMLMFNNAFPPSPDPSGMLVRRAGGMQEVNNQEYTRSCV
jgi:hypothetical protein